MHTKKKCNTAEFVKTILLAKKIVKNCNIEIRNFVVLDPMNAALSKRNKYFLVLEIFAKK